MERHCSNALELAKRLEERKGRKGRKSVKSVNYPFLPSHPQHKLAKKQMKAGSGMLLADFGLSYGDTVFVDGDYSGAARADVERIAGNYGLTVASGAPVTAGVVAPGSVRVVVSRTEAFVPGCPNWSVIAQPNYNNRTMSNLGCAVNSNLAAMVADPNDLVQGREGSGMSDALTGSKAVGMYRRQEPTGTKGLQDISTKKDDQ